VQPRPPIHKPHAGHRRHGDREGSDEPRNRDRLWTHDALIRDAPEHLGYLLKDRVYDVEVVIDGLTRVTAGECVVDSTLVARLLRRSRGRSVLDAVRPRELEVLALMAEGRSNIAIAARLKVSPKTLEAHIRRILQRLCLEESPDDHRRVLAVLEYLHAPR
jgi:DNA-binding NarL/FixJ family response regulator